MSFSVLMSVYRNENAGYFDLALRSVLTEQTVRPDELVLVCDGPLTADLDGVIADYTQAYPDILRVHRLAENGGLGPALCAGIALCSHDLVARADSDDVCMPDRFAVQLEFMEQHPDVAAVSSYIEEFLDNPACPVSRKVLPTTHEELVKMARFRNPLNHMAVMYRREAVLAVGSYRNMPYTEDYDLWVRMLAGGYRIANIDRSLVRARIGNGMIARRGNRAYIRGWRVINRFMRAQGMINMLQYWRNMLGVRVFVYVPTWVREKLYRYLLRR